MVRSFLVSILFLSFYQLSAQDPSESALDDVISIQFNNVSIVSSLRQLDRLSGVNFSYNSNIIPRDVKIAKAYRDAPIRTILTEILSEANLYFREVGSTVIILKRIYSERKVTGQVVDIKTRAPLHYVNVFIERSTLGAATDSEGNFEIDDIPDIGFNLVVSYVGYKTKVIPFNYKHDVENSKYIIEMEIDPVVLESIQVFGKAPKRFKRADRQLLKRFRREFLGRSNNAKQCRIVNPEVLNFEYLDDNDNYRVTADDILYVENRALGYRIGYLLEEFRFQNGLKLNIGSAKFQELETKSRKKYQKWEMERERAYNGSAQHFLNAMINNSLEEQGFELNLVQYDSVTSEYTTPLNPPPANEILTLEKTDKEYLYTLHATSDVEVTYKGEYEASAYKKLYRSTSKSGNYKYTDKKVRTSISLTDGQSLSSYQVFGLDVTDVDLFQKSIIFFINYDTPVGYPGQFKNPRDVLFGGWWRWGAFSDWLPLNYKPD
ncbi:carboxypeptidase-like regulatory domain-containing protein [Roseivirga sp. E12]|uniref:carboxypeptidase-like regulatory domain-containing protein n=1 Tax=Roseivirga sp. E12 TaxID=2819237 RepID=UPI001ABC6F05|nr:carboxypeptidase-like regulatory domain-containing protein [Roseivirga sp. E12]MBO3699952.1 carboxypeptidase-like regulatory domain-containing protein [Roseivirga sp. E12]